MFKKLGKLLKKGAMSVEYIVIGVCVIGMAALATAFASNKMDIAMGQENSDTSGGTNAGTGGNTNTGDNTSTPNTPSDNTPKIETESDFFEAYGIHTGEYYLWNGECDGVDRGYDTSKKCVITMDGKVNFYEAFFHSTDLYLSAMLDLKNNTFHMYDSNGQDCSEYINSFEVEINVGGASSEYYIHYIQVNYEVENDNRSNFISHGFKSCFFTEDNCE